MADGSFHDTRFPTDISLRSSGGPQRETRIITLGSGHEQRNQRWGRSRRSFEAGSGVKDLDALHAVAAFFEARRGPLYAFRYRDPVDWKSCTPGAQIAATDQPLGTGDGSRTVFALVKTYGAGTADPYRRPITRPVVGTLHVAVDGQSRMEGQHYDWDGEQASVVFRAGHEPGAGAAVSAGYEFDVPVRFASDTLTVDLQAFSAGQVPSIPLLEVLP